MDISETVGALKKQGDLQELTTKQITAVLKAAVKHWEQGLSDGDELILPGIGRIFPQRWKLGPQNNLYRTRVGKAPLTRMYTWRLKIEAEVNLKAAIRKAMSS